MAAVTYTLTGTLVRGNLVPLGAKQIKATLQCSERVLADGDGDKVVLFPLPVEIDAEGAFTISGLPSSAAGAGWQPDGAALYAVQVTWIVPGVERAQAWNSGWFELTANSDLADVVTIPPSMTTPQSPVLYQGDLDAAMLAEVNRANAAYDAKGSASAVASDLTAHESSTTAAHPASAITVTGLDQSDAQSALAALNTAMANVPDTYATKAALAEAVTGEPLAITDGVVDAILSDAGSSSRGTADGLYVRGTASAEEPGPSVGVWIDTGNVTLADEPYGLVRRTGANAALAPNTTAPIPYTTVDESPSWWDGANLCWNVPEDGRYEVRASIYVDAVAQGSRLLRIERAGASNRTVAATLVPGLAAMTGLSGQVIECYNPATERLVAGDTLTALFRHNAESDINIRSAVSLCTFSIRRVAL